MRDEALALLGCTAAAGGVSGTGGGTALPTSAALTMRLTCARASSERACPWRSWRRNLCDSCIEARHSSKQGGVSRHPAQPSLQDSQPV